MSTLAINVPMAPGRRERWLAGVGLLVFALIVAAVARHLIVGGHHWQGNPTWLVLHVATIVPAVPLGAFILARRKGDRLHRIAGRIWAGLMVVAALSSFGLTQLMGHLSPIHLLSILTLTAMPRAIFAARAGKIVTHRRIVTIVYASMLIAGFFTFIPGRLLGLWLFG